MTEGKKWKLKWLKCKTREGFYKDVITVVNNNVFILEKLLSLLPEYVVPYMIHLLAHDPDFTRSQDIDQLRDIKE